MVLVATQVKRRRGTTAENDAFTGAEGEITVDTEKHELRVHDGVTVGGFKIGGGSGAMPVGAIFITPRTGTIEGAVEANGNPYNIADYSGDGSIGALLTAGSIAYVSKAEFQTQVTNTGACDSFGWDGTADPTFLVPKLNPWHVGKSAPVVGNGMTLGLTDGSSNAGITSGIDWNGSDAGDNAIKPSEPDYGKNTGDTSNRPAYSRWGGSKVIGITTDPTKSGIVADLSETTNLRVMVQLATGATDEALETCTSVLADVAGLKTDTSGIIDYVVEKQDPTPANGYTWYRKYKSGWVEQGGLWTNPSASSSNYTQTFLIEMADNKYQTSVTVYTETPENNYYAPKASNRTTTTFVITANASQVMWQVSGKSA